MEWIVRLITARPLITCLVIGVVLMSIWWLRFQHKLNMKWYWAPILSILVMIVGLVGAKLLALIEVGFDTNRAASMRVYGAMFLCPIVTGVIVKVTKRDATTAFDALTVAAMIGGFVVRINCLISGCCDGLPIIPGSEFRWPLVEMEMLLAIVLTVYFWNRIYSGKTNGRAYPLLLLIYGIFRFIIEWVRDEYTGQIGIFHMAHIWSIISIVIGAAIYFELKENEDRKTKRRARK